MNGSRKRVSPRFWIDMIGPDHLARFGCELESVTQRKRGTHLCVRIRHRATKQSRAVFACLTPSDGRSDKNTRAQLRRLCQDLTKLTTEKIKCG